MRLSFLSLVLIFTGSFLFAQEVNVTWSEKLLIVEADKQIQKDIASSENAKTNAKFKLSKNSKLVSDQIKSLMDRKQVLQSVVLKNGSSVQLIDEGLGKPTNLVLLSGTTERMLFSNFSIKKNNSVTSTKFSVSPDEKVVALFVDSKGSIDIYQLYFIDLVTAQVVRSDDIILQNQLVWTGNDKYVFTDVNDIDFKRERQLSNPNYLATYSSLDVKGQFPIIGFCHNGQNEIHLNDNKVITLNNLLGCNWQFVRSTQNDVLIADGINATKVVRYVLDSTKESADPVQTYQLQGVYQTSEAVDGHYFVHTAWGADQKITILDSQGQFIGEFQVPQWLTIRSTRVHTAGESIDFVGTSPVSANQLITYNYKTNQVASLPDPDVGMTVNGLVYQTDVTMIAVRDGTLIPTRITKLKSTVLSPSTPVLIYVYGGFNLPGRVYPTYDGLVRDLFLAKGGVYVAPAIRGGGEFGEPWHKAGTKLNKKNTYFDLIDVSKYLVDHQMTSVNKIVTTGTSNGGLTVLASAFLSPSSFGMVLPVAGDYDLIGMDRLDPLYGPGWANDYGDPNDPQIRQLMLSYAPMEQNLSLPFPDIFLVDGLSDSRVNPLHALKMMKKFRAFPDEQTQNINAIFINNAGHGIENEAIQDLIAWRANSLTWAFVYDFLGWETDTNPQLSSVH